MKTLKTLLVLLLILFAFTSCKKKDSKDEIYRYPLTLGNTWTHLWTYTAYDYATGEIVTLSDTLFTRVDPKITSPDGEECYHLKLWLASGGEEHYASSYVINRSDGLYELGFKTLFTGKTSSRVHAFGPFGRVFATQPYRESGEIRWLNSPRLIIPRIPKKGIVWNYDDAHYLPHKSLILAKEKLELPIGKRNCIPIKTTVTLDEFSWDIYDYYCAEGLAMYKSEGVDELMNEQGEIIGEYPYMDKQELLSCELH